MEKVTKRQASILTLVEERGFASIEALVNTFGLTPQTIRRDINLLCERKILQRFHSGAALPTTNAPYLDRQRSQPNIKKQIGEMVADRIEDGSSLFINIGTTTEAVARALLKRKNLLIATNNLNVANILAENSTFDIPIAGGTLRKRDCGIAGHTATQFMSQFRMDYGIIGVSGIDEDGSLLDFDDREMETAKIIMRNTNKTLLVADHTSLAGKPQYDSAVFTI